MELLGVQLFPCGIIKNETVSMGKVGSAMSQHRGLESLSTEHFFPWYSDGGVGAAYMGSILEVLRGKIL